jgi:hypothetical protein
MKKSTLLLLAFFCASIVFGQQKVAVYVTGGSDAGINKVLGDQLAAAIVNSGKYTAIERTSSFLAQLANEQTYQRTGAVDDNQISELGKQFGVELVCVAEVNEVFEKKYVSARFIDVESAEVISTANANSAMKDMEDLLQVAESITKELIGKKAQGPSKVINSNACEELQEEKPTLRAVGKGTNVREQTAKNIAEMQARAQFARAIASKIQTVTSENAIAFDTYSNGNTNTEQTTTAEDFAKSVAEEIIKNTVIIKTCKELRADNQYDIWVCLEYQGDIAKMANEIANKLPDNQKEKKEQVRKNMEKELND